MEVGCKLPKVSSTSSSGTSSSSSIAKENKKVCDDFGLSVKKDFEKTFSNVLMDHTSTCTYLN